MKRLLLLLFPLAMLAGCAVAPYDQAYYSAYGPYDPNAVVYAPGYAPAYVAPPLYVGPPVSIDLGFSYFHGHHGHHGFHHGYHGSRHGHHGFRHGHHGFRGGHHGFRHGGGHGHGRGHGGAHSGGHGRGGRGHR